MIVVIDNTVTKRRFLSKLITYLKVKQIPFQTVRTQAQFQKLLPSAIQGIILSGSTKNIHTLSKEDHALNAAAVAHGKPILGICFGAQFLHTYLGGSLYDLGSIHCKDFQVEKKPRVRSPLLELLPASFPAQFCNQFGFSDVATKCKILATYHVEGRTMPCAFQHKTKPYYGVLFHPEEHAHTHAILDQFLETTKTNL